LIRIDDLKAVSRAIVARLFRCTPTNVNKMVSRGMPQLKDGRYDLFAVVGWRLDELAMSGGKLETREAQRWLTRYRKSRALRDEYAHKREAGEFVEKSAATAERVRLISATVSALRNLPARLTGQLVGKVDRVEIDNIINLETAALCEIMAAGVPYSDASVSAAIDKMGGMSPRQALAEKVQMQTSMPLHMRYDPRKKVFTDTRDGTVVPAAEADEYARKFTYLKFKNKNGEKQNGEIKTESKPDSVKG
jgi:hypothetical protein